jgi:hypothetical protein
MVFGAMPPVRNKSPPVVTTLKGFTMGSPAYNRKHQKYYNAESSDDAYYIGLGRIDLVPGCRIVR